MAVGMIFTFRRKTAAAWTAANPVLLAGELGLETDTRFFKFGDGATAWATLPYAAAVSSVWGSITGTLGNQTDLAAVLAGKQPLDSDLTTIAGLAVVNDNFMQAKAGAWAGRTVAQVKTDLGVPGTASGTNTGDQTITLTGDVTGSGAGTFAASISAGAVTSGKIAAGAVVNAALANMPATTIKGNATAGPAAPTDLTGTQTTAMLDLFGVALKGLVPASGGGTANFMRADGAWAAPPMTTSLPWGSITGTPTTIAGYGITDAVTLAGSQTVTGSKTFSASTAFSSGAVVTGAITGTAITQTATDTTAGRLLKVGDFGLGDAAIFYTGSVDDPTLPTGHYFAGVDSIGTKPYTYGYLSVNMRVGGIRAGQIWVTDGGNMWMRTYATGAWSPWYRVYSQKTVLGAVSQSAGVPTGAVIESGSNANGRYTKFASGLLECRQTMNAASGAAVTWTFPSAFIEGPVVTGNAIATVLSTLCFDASPTITAVTFSARDKTDARRADVVHLHAVGRWSTMV